MARKTAVVLLSGGLDSATALYLAKNKFDACRCLIFDYGQRHRKEIEAAKKIAQHARCPFQVIKISLPWKGSSLLDKTLSVPKASRGIPSTYVPARNIIFLSFAFSYAESLGAQAVVIGAHTQDYSGYPDCRPQFLKNFLVAANSGMKKSNIKIWAPLLSKGKKEIINLGIRAGVPLEHTWSCYEGGKVPCGACDSCVYRMKGFKEAGIADPLFKNKDQ